MLYFYWSYDNYINWTNFEDCDSTEVIVQGAYFEKTGKNTGIIKVGRGTISTSIYLIGYSKNKVIKKDSTRIEAGPIPLPHIYVKNEYTVWENIELLGIQYLNSDVIKNWKGFHITKNRSCPIPFIYDISNWSLNVAGKDFTGKGQTFTVELINALQNLKTGDKVILQSITVEIPNIKYSTSIKLNSELIIN